jgi:Secretion system C-terminal sorting domain
MKKYLIITGWLVCNFANAQIPYPAAPPAAGAITGIEYFIDSNPGFGSGTPLTGFISSVNINNFNGNVNITGLPAGFHRIYFRSKDADGKWSLSNNAFFDNYNVPVYATAPIAAGAITYIEYFIDADPGFGSGTSLTGFTSSPNINNFNGTANLGALPMGFHRIYFRSKDANGKWSLTNNAFFDNYTVPIYNNAPAAVGNIVQLEYFLDNNDLGFGNCTQIPVTPNTNIVNLNANINITGLAPGVHRLFIRSKDANGKWALTNFSIFDNSSTIPYPFAPAAPTNIVQVEYFLDNNDLGFGNCTQIPVTPNTTIVNLNANVNITGLIQGVHRLFIRSKDAAGKWSLTNFSVFDNSAVQPYPAAPALAPAIGNMEYYIDTDPGFGNATALTVPGNTGDINGYAVNLNLSGSLSVGTHYLYIRSKQNPWSLTNVVAFSATGVVPVNWSFVKAQLINHQTVVSWATVQESNTQKFEIEHSVDGRTFKNIGTVAAAGNSNTLHHYSFTHLQPANGFNYYRIKQTDLDGNHKYSVVVTVLKRDKLTQTLVAPNPVKDVLHLVEKKEVFVNTAEIYNIAGSLLMRKTINSDVQVFSLPVSTLSAGRYILKVHYATAIRTYQFIKE